VPPAIVSWMQATKKIKEPGVFAAEQTVDPELFFRELGKRGIKVTEHFDNVKKYF